ASICVCSISSACRSDARQLDRASATALADERPVVHVLENGAGVAVTAPADQGPRVPARPERKICGDLTSPMVSTCVLAIGCLLPGAVGRWSVRSDARPQPSPHAEGVEGDPVVLPAARRFWPLALPQEGLTEPKVQGDDGSAVLAGLRGEPAPFEGLDEEGRN